MAVAVHSSEELCALASEHGPNDHLEGAAERLDEVLGGSDLLRQGALSIVEDVFHTRI